MFSIIGAIFSLIFSLMVLLVMLFIKLIFPISLLTVIIVFLYYYNKRGQDG